MAYQSIPFATVVASDSLHIDSPVGKVTLSFGQNGEKDKGGLTVYYFKGADNEELVAGTSLAAIYLHPLIIPKEFKSVNISKMEDLKYEDLSITEENCEDGILKVGQIKEGVPMRFKKKMIIEKTCEGGITKKNNKEIDVDINGLFMLGFSPAYTVKTLTAYWKRDLGLKKKEITLLKNDLNINRYAAKKIITSQEIFTKRNQLFIDDIQAVFPNRTLEEIFPPSMIPSIPGTVNNTPFAVPPPVRNRFYSGIDGCPRLRSGSFSNTSTSENGGESKRISQSNLINSFFKFKNHYFTPLTQPNGNTFYYAFENENIIRYWLYKENQAALTKQVYAFAANAPIYSENILGIDICKNIAIVKEGTAPIQFEK